MKIRLIIQSFLAVALLMLSTSLVAQQKNVFHDQNFWRTSPTLATIQAEIQKGNSPSAMSANDFDAVSMAINNNASTEVIKFLFEHEGNSISKTTNHSRTYLHWAAARGNAEIVTFLIEKGANVQALDSHFDPPLVFASNFGMTNPAVFDAFEKAGIDLKQRLKNGATYMMLGAAYDEGAKLIDYLISKGLKLSDLDENGATVFDYAARTGNITHMQALIKKGLKPTNKALLFAAQGTRRASNGVDVYKYLIENLKLKPSVLDADGNNMLHLIARKQNQMETVNYLISKGLNPNAISKEGNNMLILAAGGMDSELVHFLLHKTPNVNIQNNKGESALTSAITTGSVDIAKMLLSHKANVQVKDIKGNNLAYYLIQSYRPARAGSTQTTDIFSEKLNLLKSMGLNVTAPQKDKSTLYHLAAQKDDLELFKKIAHLGIDINAKNDEEMTVLHKIALTAQNDKILKFLVSKNADKTIETEFGETAFDLAEQNEYLKNAKVDISFLK